MGHTMSRDEFAADLQRFQDQQWNVPLNTYPPTRTSYALTDYLMGLGYGPDCNPVHRMIRESKPVQLPPEEK